MLLIRLKLENFRQHQQTQIDFLPGMTAIVGANGTGKSTILEGITYALYGEQRQTKETLKFYWADASKKKFSSELTFVLDDKRYVVMRNSNDASLTDKSNGTDVVLATGLTETRRACEKLLGLNYDQFVNSFCAEQKNLAFLNFKNAATRQEEVGRMLGFDRLKMAENLARERRSKHRDCAEALEKTLGSLADLEKAQKEATARLKELGAEIAAIEKRQKAANDKMPAALELKLRADKWRELNQEIKQIRGQAEGLKEAAKLAQTALEQAKKYLAELKDLEPRELEYKRVEAEAKEWEKRREADRARELLAEKAKNLRAQIADDDERIKALPQSDLPALERAFLAASEKLARAERSLQESLAEWTSSSGKAQDMLTAAQVRVEEAKKALDNCEELVAKGICPECGQPLKVGAVPKQVKAKADFAEHSAALLRVQKEATKAIAKPAALKKSESQIPELKSAVERARSARDQAALSQTQIHTLQNERKKKNEQAAKLEAQLANSPAIYSAAKHEAIKKQLVALDPEHLKYLILKDNVTKIEDRERDHKKADADLEAAKTKYRGLEKERNDLQFKDEAAVDIAISAHRTIEQELREAEISLKGAQRTRDMAEAAVAQATARVQEHHQRARELSEAKAAAANYEVLARELKSLREKLNQSIRPDLEARASENLNLLTNGRYSSLTLDENFEARIIEDGVPKAVISGGEEDVVALSLRLALSELIQERNGRPMSMLILDEVFGSLDSERRQNVLDRLASLKGRFNQVLVISHIEEINQVADQALYLTRSSDTRATVVSDAPPDAAALLL